MCLACWEDEGRPYRMTDAVREWVPAFSAADKFGALHVVVEDWNLDDENILFCMNDNRLTEGEGDLCRAMLGMSVEERWALAINADHPEGIPR
jgi:hypothetical protein